MNRLAVMLLAGLGCAAGGNGPSFPDDAPAFPDDQIAFLDDGATGAEDASVALDLADSRDGGPELAADALDLGDPGPVPSHPAFVISVTEGHTAGKTSNHAFVAVSNWTGESEETGTGVATVGDCTFHEPTPQPFCDPPCPIGKVCRPGDVCGDPPGYLDAGVVTVTGLKAGLTLTPQTPYPYYQATWDPADPGTDLFDAGAVLTAQAEGKTVPAFIVQTKGVARMESPLPCALPLQKGSALEVTWTPAAQGDRVLFRMVSGNHAAFFTGLTCITGDTGKLVVDASLIALYLQDWRPLERWELVRYSEGQVVTQGGYPIVFRAAGATGCMYTF